MQLPRGLSPDYLKSLSRILTLKLSQMVESNPTPSTNDALKIRAARTLLSMDGDINIAVKATSDAAWAIIQTARESPLGMRLAIM